MLPSLNDSTLPSTVPLPLAHCASLATLRGPYFGEPALVTDNTKETRMHHCS